MSLHPGPKVRIVSDGSPLGWHVYVDDKELKNVVGITIAPVSPNDRIARVSLELILVELDITGELIDTTGLSDDTRHAVRGRLIDKEPPS